MYLNGPIRGLGQDGVTATDILSQLTTPTETTSLSPLMMAGLGLLAVAFLLSRGKKTVAGFKRRSRAKQRRKARILAAKAELKAAKG
jgi:predicted PurR-regulated permease PerM